MDDDIFNNPYILQVYNEPPLFCHLPYHVWLNICIVSIGSEEPIMNHYAADDLI